VGIRINIRLERATKSGNPRSASSDILRDDIIARFDGNIAQRGNLCLCFCCRWESQHHSQRYEGENVEVALLCSAHFVDISIYIYKYVRVKIPQRYTFFYKVKPLL
jgi:hypothetical protein